MLQNPFTDRHSSGRVTQCFAFKQLAGEFDTIQSLIPVQIR
jgi:hypothetical protein